MMCLTIARSRRKGEVFMRYLLLILLLPLMAASAYSQSDTPTNPDKAPCGLPAQGTIVASEEYTLNANCTQTGTLEIKTAETPNITLTINGAGHTITNSSFVSRGVTYGYNFLIVDNQGLNTLFDADVTASPNVKVIIKNVTFDGNGWSFRGHRYQGGGEYCSGSSPCWTFFGSGISAEGTLEMENVTFTGGNGSWLRAGGDGDSGESFSLKIIGSPAWDLARNSRGVVHVTNSGSVTLRQCCFPRHRARSHHDRKRRQFEHHRLPQFHPRMVAQGAPQRRMGWLRRLERQQHRTLQRQQAQIGNGGQAVVAYSLPKLNDCGGLPSSGTIEGTVVYTLTQPCVCVSTVNIAVGASVTINANGNRIDGCSSGDGFGRFRYRQRSSDHQQRILENIRVSHLRWPIYLNRLECPECCKGAHNQLRLGLSVKFAFREQ